MNVHKKEKKNYIVLLYAFIHIIIYKTKKIKKKRTRTESRSTKINVAQNKALLRFSQ